MASPPSPSSDSSFHTAPSSPIRPSFDVEMSDAPIDDGSEILDAPASSPKYRPGKPITAEIVKHCDIFLDEQLYGSALALLGDLVTSGASHPDAQDKPAFVPIPYHIELVSALLIHPRYTNQSPPDERLELASKSITFLRNTLHILGPINANLVEAFSFAPFTSTRTSRRSRNTLERDDGTSGSDSDDKPERMKGIIANKGRIRRCAKDFWHIVGWAFNCSIKHPKRWQYWKVYLDYMLDVLDADWNERERMDRITAKESGRECDYQMVRKGLLIKYLSDSKGKSSAMKRVVRSVFADGGSDSLRDFPEVFENETKEVIYNGQKRKRADTMDQKFGDYDEDEGIQLADGSSSPMREDDEDDEEIIPEVDPYLGGTESIALRQRLLTFLSRASFFLPDEITDINELYEMIFANLKQVPLPAFSLIMSPSSASLLNTQLFVSVALLMLLRLLPNNAPRPSDITNTTTDELTQEVFEKCFLPFLANTSSTDDNAKVSILTENCFRLYLKNCKCAHTPGLDEAIETGIKAREMKIKGDKKPKDIGARNRQDVAREWLKASGERLRSLLSFIEMKTLNDWDSGTD